jgi:hypothetical protein
MTYVSALIAQADPGIVSGSTIERKQMSTKTNYKRIALVAIASLGFGVLTSVSPAKALNSGDLTGKVAATLGTAINAATVAAATATTASAPLAITAVAGSSVKFTVDADTAAADLASANAFSDAAFSVASTVWTTEGVTEDCINTSKATTQALVTCKMPTDDGVYYLRLTKVTHAYVKITVVNIAAALGDGFSSTSGSATVASNVATTLNAVAGPANTVTLTALRTAASGKAGLVTVSGGGTISSVSAGGTIAANTLSAQIANGGLATVNVVIATPTVGTITASYFEETSAGSGIFAATASQTVAITVNATAQTNVYNAAKSTAYVNTGDSAGTSGSDVTYAPGLTASSTLSTSDEKGTITVTQNDAAGNALTSGFKTVSATITGGGLLGTASDTPTGAAVSSAAGAVTDIKIFANGTATTAGGATVTVSVDGAVVKTVKVTFYGPVATLTPTVKKNYLQASTNTIADVIFVDAKDANGNLVADTPTITSATTGVALTGACAASDPTTTPATPAKCTVTTGATSGSSVLTIKASGVTTVTTTATINVSQSVAKTIVLATDKTSYAPGAKATLSLTLTDADGKPVASGDYVDALVAGNLTPSAALTTALKFNSTDTTITVLDGKATVDFFVPISTGPVTISGTYGAGAVVGTLASTALTTSFTVAAPANAEIATLTTLVNSLIAKINALNKLVIKIQKKVRA